MKNNRVCIVGAKSAGGIGPEHKCSDLPLHGHVSRQRKAMMIDAGEAIEIEGTNILRHAIDGDTSDRIFRIKISPFEDVRRMPGGPPNGLPVWQRA